MGEYLFRIAGENRLTTNYYKIGGFLSSSLGGFTGRYRGPPRMEAGGRDYVD